MINKLKINVNISSDRNENVKTFLEFSDEYRTLCRLFGYDEKLYSELKYDYTNSDHETSVHFVNFGHLPLKIFKLVELNNKIYFFDKNDKDSKKEGNLIKLSSLKNDDSFWIYENTTGLNHSINILKIHQEITSDYTDATNLMDYLEDNYF